MYWLDPLRTLDRPDRALETIQDRSWDQVFQLSLVIGMKRVVVKQEIKRCANHDHRESLVGVVLVHPRRVVGHRNELSLLADCNV